jgi:ring-1,2-phenylacetyl-CoA epoxidase subunit PaaD
VVTWLGLSENASASLASGPGARSDAAQRAFLLAAQIPDPEIPVLTLLDLGILRDVQEHGEELCVTLTPTYSGCPATEVIATSAIAALSAGGFDRVRVSIVLSPAWTTDWISAEGRAKLKAYGITPPNCMAAQSQQVVALRRKESVPCPRCDAVSTEQLSNFGSTPCKSLYRCLSCREPFDYFKPY